MNNFHVFAGYALLPCVSSLRTGGPAEPAPGTLPGGQTLPETSRQVTSWHAHTHLNAQVSHVRCTEEKGRALGFLFSIIIKVLGQKHFLLFKKGMTKKKKKKRHGRALPCNPSWQGKTACKHSQGLLPLMGGPVLWAHREITKLRLHSGMNGALKHATANKRESLFRCRVIPLNRKPHPTSGVKPQ